MVQECVVLHDQTGAGLLTRRLRGVARVVVDEPDDGQVGRGGMGSQLLDGGQNVGLGRLAIHEHQHGAAFLRGGGERPGIGHGLHPVVQVLQAIHELRTG